MILYFHMYLKNYPYSSGPRLARSLCSYGHVSNMSSKILMSTRRLL